MMLWIQRLLLAIGSAGLGVATSACTFLSNNPTASAPTAPSPTQAASPPQAPSPTQVASTAENFQLTPIVEGLERPWSMAWLPDGSMLITEKGGQLRLVRDGVLQPTPIAGVPEVLTAGQGGLLDVSVHPRFAENRWVYLTYAHGTSGENRTRIARARLDGNTLSDLQVIFEVSQAKPAGQHFGSRILWLPDNTMLVSIGDGGNPPVELEGQLIRQQAQNLRSRLGKIIRLNDDGSVPTDNPFATNANADSAIWSYGHRNIQGLAFDPQTQRVWATEHGARGGDEVNLAAAGQNYGWPLVTYSREYSGGEISPDRSRPGLVDPKLVWDETVAPSGLALYRGDRFPAWQGDLFAGGLVSQTVHRLDLDEAGNVQGQQDISIGQRVRDVRQGPDGLLYILTDESNGQLIRLEPAS